MKGAVRPFAQQERHLGSAVRQEVVDVAELVVRGAEPPFVGLDAHQRAHVLVVVDVPGGGVGVLLARQPRRNRVEVAGLPERRRQLREPQRGVKALGALHDGFGRRSLEQGIEVGRINQAGPVLGPAVSDPVRRDEPGRRPLVAGGQLVLRPAVKAIVERLGGGDGVVEQLHHLVDGHAVVGDLEGEVGLVAHLARHLVSQLHQLDEPGAERAGQFPSRPSRRAAARSGPGTCSKARRCRWR